MVNTSGRLCGSNDLILIEVIVSKDYSTADVTSLLSMSNGSDGLENDEVETGFVAGLLAFS